MIGRPLILTGGPIWTGSRDVEALAIVGGTVGTVGSLEDVRAATGADAAVVDVEGRRVVPGLIDSHVHVVRAGLTWNQIVRWDTIESLADGLAAIRRAASEQPKGSWIRVLGGWHPGRFGENRGPTRAELDDAAGEHPAYVQLLYEEGLLNTRGLELLVEQGELPGVERSDDGALTGRVVGPAAFGAVASMFETPTPADRRASTQALASDLASRGVTGAIDPGGFGLGPESYRTVFDLWRDGALDLRTRLYLVPLTRGDEVAEVREWVRFIQPGFGDDMLRYVGMGEILSFGVHDMEGVRPFEVDPSAKADLLEMSDLLARHDWPIHMHAIFDTTISAVLDVWEEIHRRYGLPGRRFSLAHAEPIQRPNLERVQKLGIGIAVQNRLMYRSADSAALWGHEIASYAPPLGDILELGIPLGAGTDATVVSPHDPWLSIWWLVTGRSFDGAPPRAARHRLSVHQALTAYTQGSAWFSFDEGSRGTLEPGRQADLAVLSHDPFGVDPDRLPEVGSELTLLAGRPTHVGSAFVGFGR